MAQLPTLTIELVTEYLRRAVAEYGEDYIDPGYELGHCQNIYRDADTDEVTGRCIAAQVLSYHGASDPALESCNNRSIESVLDLLEVDTHNDAGKILSRAQGLQDNGQRWGSIAEQLITECIEGE